MRRKYYIKHDFYHMKSDRELTILPQFMPYQQTTPSTCGPCCLLATMRYFGVEMQEMEIAKAVDCRFPGGTKISKMIDFMVQKGFRILSSEDMKRNEDGKIFTFTEFKRFVIENLEKGYPIIIENIEAGGHYRVIIGYDRVSQYSGNERNDMLIFMDPWDQTDVQQDGYTYDSAYRTFLMWFDDHHLETDQKYQPFMVVQGLAEKDKPCE